MRVFLIGDVGIGAGGGGDWPSAPIETVIRARKIAARKFNAEKPLRESLIRRLKGMG